MMWTDEKIKALTVKWRSGQRASTIASDLGISRSAVLAKLNRLGMLGLTKKERKRRESIGKREWWVALSKEERRAEVKRRRLIYRG
jgi:hypothetical protein